MLIGIGGGIGSIMRYLISSKIQSHWSNFFPLGTLVVNMLGSLLIGFILVLIAKYWMVYKKDIRALVTIGFLGGFTTFSTFSNETVQMIRDGNINGAVFNIGYSVGACLIMVYLGQYLASKF
ncbi:MAG: camphor resistance protein CrcB [Francisellaceae bacterium]|nr:camphor resistance protein CrcB [Francisellaceae bacterium]